MTAEFIRSCNSQHTDQKSLQSIDVEPEFQVKQVPVSIYPEEVYSQQPPEIPHQQRYHSIPEYVQEHADTENISVWERAAEIQFPGNFRQ